MTKNDTDTAYQHQNLEIENQLLNFCVGKSVGGKSPEVSRQFLKVFRIQFNPDCEFDTVIYKNFFQKTFLSTKDNESEIFI